MPRPKRPPKVPAPENWNAITNTHRKRPQRLITMSPEGWAELDRRRGEMPVGRYLESLLGVKLR